MVLIGIQYSLFSIVIISAAMLLWAFISVMILIDGYALCRKEKWQGSSQAKAANLVNQQVKIYIIESCLSICQMDGKSTCSERKCSNSGAGAVIVIFSIVNVRAKGHGCAYATLDYSFNLVFSKQLIRPHGKSQLFPMMSMNLSRRVKKTVLTRIIL